MLRTVKTLRELDFGALMAVYAEGNRDNTRDQYPDLPELQGILQAEQDFYQYLREVFFPTSGAVYAVWQVDGQYVSALRLEPYRDGLLLEALETAPDQRGKGYAFALVQEVMTRLVPGKLYSHVHKRNIPSLKLHEKLGFQRISEQAAYIDGSVNDRCCTLCKEK